MRILVTNDDGINAEGIKALAKWAQSLGEVTVVAPSTVQSGRSHAINISEPIRVAKVDYLDGIVAYSVDSTPADCVRFATIGLQQTYDLVLSGINNGYNLGEDILYSGTAGAVFEASLRGIRGIAFSAGRQNLDSAVKQLDLAYRFIVDNRLFDADKIFNVNFPVEYKGIRITRQGGAYYSDEFVEVADNCFDQRGYSVYEHGCDLTLDTDATMNGYVSITPLSTKRDDERVYDKLKNLAR